MPSYLTYCQVYRISEGRRWCVYVFGFGTGCIATGATLEEAEEKAERWTKKNLENRGLLGKIACLQVELARLSYVLSNR
jgi:hypothetical protein